MASEEAGSCRADRSPEVCVGERWYVGCGGMSVGGMSVGDMGVGGMPGAWASGQPEPRAPQNDTEVVSPRR